MGIKGVDRQFARMPIRQQRNQPSSGNVFAEGKAWAADHAVPASAMQCTKAAFVAVNGPETCTVSLFPSDGAPQVAKDLSYELVQRQAACQTIAAAEPGRTQSEKNLSAWFHTRIRKLLERGET